jgi:hypothetical protein
MNPIAILLTIEGCGQHQIAIGCSNSQEDQVVEEVNWK